MKSHPWLYSKNAETEIGVYFLSSRIIQYIFILVFFFLDF